VESSTFPLPAKLDPLGKHLKSRGLDCNFLATVYRRGMRAPERVRIDKWLWAVRLFKSRSLASEACTAGHVTIGGQPVKPSRDVQVGEVIAATCGPLHRTVRVVALLGQRVGAKVLSEYLEDLTPAAEYERARSERSQALTQFPKGWGRPTKKQRRQMDEMLHPERS
jgi:ribosome-associated heat shock protein Hsp15